MISGRKNIGRHMANFPLYLNEIRKNRAANPERSPLMHRPGDAPAGDRPALFARFSLSFVPFTQAAS
jgi:hypothetical protein